MPDGQRQHCSGDSYTRRGQTFNPRLVRRLAAAGATAVILAGHSQYEQDLDHVVHPIPVYLHTGGRLWLSLSGSHYLRFQTIAAGDVATMGGNVEMQSNQDVDTDRDHSGGNRETPSGESDKKSGIENRVADDSMLDIKTVAQSMNIPPEFLVSLEQRGVRTAQDATRAFLLSEHLKWNDTAKQIEDEEKPESPLLPSDFSLKDNGVGGLGHDFEAKFRQLFTSRMFPPQTLSALGLSHIRGVLLHGAPGCGKTLIARQITTVLNSTKVTTISGPEVFNKWVGGSEQNVRALFKDAEAEWKAKGEGSSLHVIIIDEIDALCGKRTPGSSCDVRNSVVNQILAKMDGVDQINNFLMIGTTNHPETIDPALLRPGRFELRLEVGLPNEAGRRDILGMKTRGMVEEGVLGEDMVGPGSVLDNLAKATQGFSGADLMGLVRKASLMAMDRCIDFSDASAPPDLSKLKLGSDDFHRAMAEIVESKVENV